MIEEIPFGVDEAIHPSSVEEIVKKMAQCYT